MHQASRHRYPYVLIKAIGDGGYADVFRARHRTDGGPEVAFKRAKPFEDATRRMAREIGVLREIDHPNVMPLIDSSPDSDWFAMPLADGNLYDLWRAGVLGRDGESVATKVVLNVSKGLQAAHDLGHVHRDISPTNILRLSDAIGTRWVVSDWGLVRRPAGQTTSRLTARAKVWEHEASRLQRRGPTPIEPTSAQTSTASGASWPGS